MNPEQHFRYAPAASSPRRSVLRRPTEPQLNHRPVRILRDDNATDQQNVQLIPAFKLSVLKEFECHKYSYKFTPEVSSSLAAMLLEDYSAMLWDDKHLYMPSKNHQIESVWFRKFYLPERAQLSMKDDIHLETNYVGTVTDRKLVFRLLFQKTSDLIQQHYLGTAQGSNFCEEVILTTFPGQVMGIKNLDVDKQKSVAVFCNISKRLAVKNIFQRLQLLDHCPNGRALLNSNLLGRRVTSAHRPGREYIIESIEKTTASFPINIFGSKEQTFKAFYKEYHGLEASDDNQKIIYIKESIDLAKILAVLPEFCEMIPEDNPFVVNESICHQNFNKFMSTCCNNRSMIAELFAEWGFKFTNVYSITNIQNFSPEKTMESFKKQQSESKYTNLERFSQCRKALYRQPFARTISEGFANWAIVAPPKKTARFVLERLKEAYRKLAKEIQIEIKEPYIAHLSDDHRETWADTTKEYFEKLEEAYESEGPEFVIVIFDSITPQADIYSLLKAYAYQRDFALQIVQLRNLNSGPKSRDDIVANMFSQINCKLGGIPWMIEMPFKDIVLVGIHTYQNCIAFCAFDAKWHSWLFEARFVDSQIPVDKSGKLINFLHPLLELYSEKNGHFPKQVLMVCDFEDKEIIQQCTEYNIVLENLIKQIIENYNVNAEFVSNLKELPSELLYCRVSESCSWEENTKDQISLMTPFNTPQIFSPAMIRLCNKDSFPLTNGRADGRIRSMSDIQRALFLNSFLYYNAANFSPLPAICMYARKLAIFSKNIIKREVEPTQQMHFL